MLQITKPLQSKPYLQITKPLQSKPYLQITKPYLKHKLPHYVLYK